MKKRFSLLLCACFLLLALPAPLCWAAFDASAVWEVRTTGSDSNGGGFVASLGGTDYSQQDSPQATGTVTSSTTTVTATTSIFTAAMVGNYITDGTTWKEITAFTSATVVTVDSAPSWTSASIKVGGALATPGKAGSLMVAGNDLYIKAGTYSITSATANIAGGCLSLPNSGAASNITRAVGYQTTRGDNGTKPLLQASGISTFTLVTGGTSDQIINIEVDGAGLTSSKGIQVGGPGMAYRCKADNCKNGGIVGIGSYSGQAVQCECTGCSSVAAFAISAFGCTAHDNTSTGFTGNAYVVGCLSCNNSGPSSDGFAPTNGYWAQDTAYNNGRDGIRITAATSTTVTLLNDIAEGNAGYGYNASGAFDSVYIFNCAGYNNTSGLVNNTNIPVGQQIGLITCTAEIFTNAAGNDFSLNNTTNGGNSCRAAGILGAFPGLSTTSYQDVGAVQSQSTGGSSGAARRHR